MKHLSLLLMLLALLAPTAGAQGQRIGAVKGTVLDSETHEPLVGVNVAIRGTTQGAATDIDGKFSIEQVPVGSYAIAFTYIGYEPVGKTDVIVRSQRITFVEAELRQTTVAGAGVEVHAGYFAQTQDHPLSATGLSGEEVRRTPGSAGDVSRIVFGLPSVAKVADTKNSLVVRGGGPTENGFYIDNIEIPNINHFPEQGSSGGPIGLVNVDFIRNVDFYTGGFSAVYGDKLSSIMDIDFREGNTDATDLQLDMNFAGFGAVAEGPLAGGRGSYLVSARRSFLDFIVGVIGEDQTSIPQYGDVQSKVTFDLSPKHKLSILEIFSADKIGQKADDAVDNEENMYSDFNFTTNTAGVNWQYLWSRNGFSNTSVAHSWSKYDFQAWETRKYIADGVAPLLLDIRPAESEFKLRNVNHYRFNASHAMDAGLEIKHIRANYDNYYGEYHDELGNPTPAFSVIDDISATKLFAFAGEKWTPSSKIALTAGARVGHYTYNGNTHVSPRMSVRYSATSTFSVNAAAGVFHQYLPLPLLTQNESNKDLNDPTAYHAIVGFEKLLSDDTRLTVEAYDKEYRNFPLDPMQPQIFPIDQVVGMSLYVNENPLVDNGRAYTRGVEMMLQKKLAHDFYGLLSAAYFRSRYRDYDGVWRNRMFDNRLTFQVEGGYKPNTKWEYSIRWLYGGGRPYTPFDAVASQAAGWGILDTSNINGDRLPAYHALNVRVDRRFHYSGSNLIAYLSVWNAYGRVNVSGYEWNEVLNARKAVEGWGLLPIFGLEFEF